MTDKERELAICNVKRVLSGADRGAPTTTQHGACWASGQEAEGRQAGMVKGQALYYFNMYVITLIYLFTIRYIPIYRTSI